MEDLGQFLVSAVLRVANAIAYAALYLPRLIISAYRNMRQFEASLSRRSRKRPSTEWDFVRHWDWIKDRWIQRTFLTVFVLLTIGAVAILWSIEDDLAGRREIVVLAPGIEEKLRRLTIPPTSSEEQPLQGPTVSAPELEQLLRDRLPDKVAVEHRQRELMDSLREIASSIRENSATSGPRWWAQIIASAVLLCAVGLIAVFGAGVWLKGGWKVLIQASGVALFSIGTVLSVQSIFGGITLVKTDGPILSVPVSYATGGRLDRGYLSVSQSAPDCLDGAGRVERVLDKPLAPSNGNAEDVLGGKVRDAIENVRKLALGRELIGIVLVGSADKRRLRPQTANYYGTNEGLAQARAQAVKRALEREFPRTLPPILMMLNTGPTIFGTNLTAEELSEDRTVLICVIWGPAN